MISEQFRHNWEDQQVEEHWDRVATIYISENNKVKKTHDQRFSESIRHLNPVKDDYILNVSSRDGEADDYIKKECEEVTVINAEISNGLIREALKVRPNIKCEKISTYSKLPFENGSFSKILTLETLEHVSEPLKFLSELHRVGKPDCKMVLTCPPSSAEIPYQIYTRLFGGHGEGPHRFPHPREVKKMLELTNWKLLLHYGTVLIPVGPNQIQSFGERIIKKLKGTWIENLGIRQFYICDRN